MVGEGQPAPEVRLRFGFAARLLAALLWLLGRLPLRFLQAIGAWLGRRWHAADAYDVRVARRNLELCLPDLDAPARELLVRQCLEHTGRSLLELAWIWFRPLPQVLARIEVGEAARLLAEAAGDGPVIVAAPHLGSWEVLNLWLCSQRPLAVLYRPPRQRWLEALLNHARSRAGAEPVPATRSGVRRLVSLLREGSMLGILPDQQPKQGDGDFAPFFGRPALTMNLLPRLVRRFDAEVLLAWAERLPRGAGWRLHLTLASPAPTDAGLLNAQVEHCARQALAQYQWTYRRFGVTPQGAPSPYADLRRP